MTRERMSRNKQNTGKPVHKHAQRRKVKRLTQGLIASHFRNERTYIGRVINGQEHRPELRQLIIAFVARKMGEGWRTNRKLREHLFGNRNTTQTTTND